MSVIDFHNDLKKYSSNDIKTIAKYLNLYGSLDDLRWMIAVHNFSQNYYKSAMPVGGAVSALVDVNQPSIFDQ